MLIMEQRDELIKRIEINPRIMGGKPVIHGTRIAVGLILGLLVEGWTNAEILAEYKINEQDIAACLLW
jgi:uncharacterized protein (DUF433 family)